MIAATRLPIPTAADLSPAGIAVRNASVGVSDLVLKRDIYYTQYPGRIDYVPVFGTTVTLGTRPSSSISCPIPPSFPALPTSVLMSTSSVRTVS